MGRLILDLIVGSIVVFVIMSSLGFVLGLVIYLISGGLLGLSATDIATIFAWIYGLSSIFLSIIYAAFK